MTLKPAVRALLLMGALTGCDSATGPAPSLPALAAALDDGMVPIALHETAVPAPDALPVTCEPAFAGVTLPSRLLATGVATHLGQVSSIVSGSACVLDLATGTLAVHGAAVHTAANGDTLDATWTGTISGTALALEITFVGGTGRFTDATGWASATGSMDFATGRATWDGVGRIRIPRQ